MSEREPSHERPLAPEALAVPEDFWEAPLPPVVTDLPPLGDDAGHDVPDGAPDPDLSLPPLWTDDGEPDRVPVPDEPNLGGLRPATGAGWAALPAAAPMWWWAAHDDRRAGTPAPPDEVHAERPFAPEPMSIGPAELDAAHAMAAPPAPPARVHGGWGGGRRAERWSGNGVRAALVAVVLGLAALVALAGRGDPPRPDLVESADAVRTPVTSIPTTVSTTVLPPAANPVAEAPAAPPGDAGPGGGPAVAARTGSGDGAELSPAGGGGSPRPAASPRRGGGGSGDGGGGEAEEFFYFVAGPAPPPPPPTGGSVGNEPPRAPAPTAPRPSGTEVPTATDPPAAGNDPAATDPAAGRGRPAGGDRARGWPPVAGSPEVPCNLLPPGRAGCPGGEES